MITPETMSHTLRRMFVKETDAPIQIIQDPYFLYMIDLFDEYCANTKSGGLKDRLVRFLDCVNKCGGEQQFAEASRSVRDEVIVYVMAKPEYQHFITCDMYEYKTSGEQANLYTKENDGKAFISIDLVKANFAALRRFNKGLVDGKDSYEDFIAQFTEYEHFRNSRQVRQYIFGNLNPKRQMTIARYLIGHVAEAIKLKFPGESIVASSHDEVVMTTTSGVTGEQVESLIATSVQTRANPLKVKVEEFLLERIGDHPFYLKQFDLGAFQLKSVPEYFLPQVYKHVRKMPLNDMDLSFFFEGKIARFLEPLTF